jgi:hypothetical protein
VIVTADHGEAFGEHGTVYHGFSLYEEEIRARWLSCSPCARPTLGAAYRCCEIWKAAPSKPATF